MTKNVIVLTKILLRSSFSSTKSKMNSKKKGMVLLYGFLFLYLGGFAGFFSYEMASVILSINQGGYFVVYDLMICIGITVFTTIFSSINALYFSKDNEHILPLPFKEEEIVLGKTNYILFYNYLYLLFLGLIPLSVYGFLAAESVLYYIFMVLVILLIPVIPTVLVNYIVIVIMSFTKRIKHKNILQYMGYFVIIMFSMSISFFTGSASNYTEAEILFLLNRTNGLLPVIRKVLPFLNWPIDVLVDKSVSSLLLFAGVTLLCYVLYGRFSRGLYFKGVVGCLFSSEGTSKKKVNEKKAYQSNGLFVTYLLKEFRSLYRRPYYLLQAVFPALIFPFVMFFSLYMSLTSTGEISREMMQELMANPANYRYILLGVFGFILLNVMMIFISSTAISREGESALFMKYIPVPFLSQILYKASLDAIFCLISSAISLVLVTILLSLPIHLALVVFGIMIPFATSHSLILICIDLAHPKLHWTSEVQVMKNNLNSLGGIAYSFFGAILLVPFIFFRINAYLIALILIVVFTVITGLTYVYIEKNEAKFAANIL